MVYSNDNPSIWNIVIPEEDTSKFKMDGLSRWACKYCIKNDTSNVKSYIANSMASVVYCWYRGKDDVICENIDQADWKKYKQLSKGSISVDILHIAALITNY